MPEKIVIAGSCRTPMGKLGGQLKDFTALELLEVCLKETLRRSGFTDLNRIDEVIAAQVAQSSDAPNIARVAALKIGIPIKVPAFTVQRNCGSGLQAIVSACQMIKAGEAKVVLVGGVENMSNIPYVNRDLRFGKRYYDSKLVDALMEGLTDPILGKLMGELTEDLAQKEKINREDQDAFAASSHQKAFRASREGKFKSQIVSLSSGGKVIAVDEGITPSLNAQMLAATPEKYFFKKGGSVHYGNSCPTSDGAAAMLVMTANAAEEYKIQPEAEILSYAFAGCDPAYMGMGPAYAIPRVLAQANQPLSEVDIFEINEAFAAQVLACQRNLAIPLEKVNPWGGAIATGHPIAATGMILTTKLIAILKDRQKNRGVVSMCIGGGQGAAMGIKELGIRN
jgi:acetyl-CoA C-acetyltransferase